MSTSLTIRRLEAHEFSMVWPVVEPIIRAGKTYSYDPGLSQKEAEAIWMAEEKIPYVALAGETNSTQAVGTFYIRPNQLGLGDHIANGGFMVAPGQCGKGYGTAMGERMVAEAKQLGYHGMQFNFIVEDNEPSLRIWRKLEFDIVGTVPDAFRHAEKGLMPVHILYKTL